MKSEILAEDSKLKNCLHFFKSVLVGIVVSLILILLFAIVLKIFPMTTNAISYVNQVIKVLSILFVVLIFTRKYPSRTILKGALCGVVYSIVAFLLFSLLNGGVHFSSSTLVDILFSVLIGALCGLLLKAFRRN